MADLLPRLLPAGDAGPSNSRGADVQLSLERILPPAYLPEHQRAVHYPARAVRFARLHDDGQYFGRTGRHRPIADPGGHHLHLRPALSDRRDYGWRIKRVSVAQ